MKKLITVISACVAMVAASLLLQACGSSSDSARRAESQPRSESAGRQSADANARPALPEAAAAHSNDARPAGPLTPANDPHHGHSHGDTNRVPAYAKTAAELKSLPPTLSPQMFPGKARAAYAAVREIPETIAQLPCYCYCDEGHGHKSLHTCFVDEHASHCAVCVDEALLAYSLHKEAKLTPAQIRERIVAQYSRAH